MCDGFSAINCCVCGVTFQVPTQWERERRENHAGFKCPNGHPLVFNGPSANERRIKALEQDVARLERRVDYLSGSRDSWEAAAKHAMAQVRGFRGVLTRARKNPGFLRADA